jgi:hypothetical protein
MAARCCSGRPGSTMTQCRSTSSWAPLALVVIGMQPAKTASSSVPIWPSAQVGMYANRQLPSSSRYLALRESTQPWAAMLPVLASSRSRS